MAKRKTVSMLLMIWMTITACGYRFTGGGDLPEGIRLIYVDILENRTAETGLENIITNDIIYEITRSGKASLADREKADAVLKGVIRSLQTAGVTHSGVSTALERRITVTVDLKLISPKGDVMWVLKGLSANETYTVESNKPDTDQNKRQAVIELSKRLSEIGYRRLTEDF